MKRLLLVPAFVLVVACGKPAAPPTSVPLFDGLGSHARAVTTGNPESQRYFDQGLNFLMAFNHDEAIRSFTRATELDPDNAMAFWGIATACGPHINFPLVPEDRAKSAWAASEKARAAARKVAQKPADAALIATLAARFADPQPADRKPLDEAYAAAMREVAAKFPEDADVAALFAESMMDLRPWDLWQKDGSAQPGTDEIVATLEGVLAKAPDHPLANHLYIHAVEASPHPERAAAAAERLRDLQPGLGHMVHMPTHIDVRTGNWEKAIASNAAANEADVAYRERAEKHQGFYRLYMAHNRHMRAFGAMMLGRSEEAIGQIRTMVAEMPEDWKKDYAPIADGFIGMTFEVLMRFGKWDEILAEPEPAATFPIARALRLYARGVAYAAKGMTKEARAEQEMFLAHRATIGADVTFGNNTAADLLAVAEYLLEGEIAFREGEVEKGLTAMRAAVEREDALRYDEPPDWIQPVRHALGASLLKAGQVDEAEAVYRRDLEIHPRNGWSLYGLSRALELKKHADAKTVRAQFDDVWKSADLELSSSCFCQPGV
jgi:tetratricopeptide (TPR) repeat protein